MHEGVRSCQTVKLDWSKSTILDISNQSTYDILLLTPGLMRTGRRTITKRGISL